MERLSAWEPEKLVFLILVSAIEYEEREVTLYSSELVQLKSLPFE